MSNGTSGPGFASPPCFAHELALGDHGYDAVDPVAAGDVARWRRSERERLIAARLELPVEERRRVAAEVASELDRLVEPRDGLTISLYWPFRSELDLRAWMERIAAKKARVALPVVVGKGLPLVFREWRPGCRMERGIWNIPVPADGDELVPDVTVAPLVGYDPDCYRLGYGGGFFDRTLAALEPRPSAIGVGHPVSAIRTIYAQPHDIPMDVVVTGTGRTLRREPGR